MLKRKKASKRAGTRSRNITKRKIKNQRLRIIVLFLVVILFSVVATEIFYILYKIRYVKVLNAKLEVGDAVGFALGEEKFDIINFGTVTPGSSGKRFLTIGNQDEKDLFAHIIVIGCIKKFLAYENNFILKVNETKKLEFTAFVPENTEKGKFRGKIFLIFKKT